MLIIVVSELCHFYHRSTRILFLSLLLFPLSFVCLFFPFILHAHIVSCLCTHKIHVLILPKWLLFHNFFLFLVYPILNSTGSLPNRYYSVRDAFQPSLPGWMIDDRCRWRRFGNIPSPSGEKENGPSQRTTLTSTFLSPAYHVWTV